MSFRVIACLSSKFSNDLYVYYHNVVALIFSLFPVPIHRDYY